ncbi:MAG: flagellar motor switch protein FliG [Candidatus Eisenbacteria bacterium]
MPNAKGGLGLNDLGGAQKASALLISIGAEAAARVLGLLSEGEVEMVTAAMARLDAVPRKTIEDILAEYDTLHEATDQFLHRGREFAFEALERAWGTERAERTVSRVQGAADPTGFDVLKEIDEEQLLSFVHREHPQTVALILAHLRPRQAAGILRRLDTAKQADIIGRMASLEKVAPETIQQVKESLSHMFSSWKRSHAETGGGVETVAEILNLLDRPAEKKILADLENSDAALAARIRLLLFTFEDILKLTANDVRQVLKEIDSATLALALKAASEELKEKIFENVSQRAAEMLRDEIEYMGPVRLKAVEEAQHRVTETVLRLDEAGQVTIARGGEGEEIVA